jgi:hypothetical protein
VRTVLKHAGKVAAGGALSVLVFLAALVVGAACWVIGSEAWTERASRELLACRGNADCLGPAEPALAAPAPKRPKKPPSYFIFTNM